MNLFELFGTIAITGADKAQEDIDETSGKASNLGSNLKKGIGTVAKWGAAIGTAAAGATTALVKMATNSAATTDNIDKMSQKIGISRDAYQELDFICSQSGTSVDSLQAGVKTLTASMDKAASGTKANVEQFEKLGVSVTNADGSLRSQEDVLFDTMSALQKMDNQTEKARLATELFGRSGTELMPLLNGAAGSIDEMKQQAHDLGLVLDDETIDSGVELTDTMDQMKRALSTLVTKLGGSLMPIVTKLCKFIIDNLPKIEKIFDDLAPILEQVFDDLLPILMDLADEVLPIIMDLFEELLPVISEIIKKILPIFVDIIKAILPPLIQIVEAILPPLKSILDILLPIISAFLDVLTPILDVITSMLTPIYDLAGSALNAIAEAFGFATEKTSEAVQAARDEADAMRAVLDASNEARQAVDDKAAAELGAVTSAESLWKELQTLADEQGNVAEKDKARAEFITTQLSEALGTEIQWTGNQISNYKTLQDEIDKTIEKKKAEILLAASEENYKVAIQNRAEAEKDLNDKLLERNRTQQECDRLQAEGISIESQQWKDAVAMASAAQESYVSAKKVVQGYYDDIAEYEEAQSLILQGKTDEAVELMSQQGQAFKTATELAGKSAEEQQAILEKQMEDAAVKMSTQAKMLNELSSDCTAAERKVYEDALKESQDYFAKAATEYKNAGGEIGSDFFKSVSSQMSEKQFENVGAYMIDGITSGAKANKVKLMQEMAKIMQEAVTETQKAGEIHSPSRLFARKVGAFIPSGIAAGVEENEEDAIKPVQDIISDMSTVDIKNVGKSAIAATDSNAATTGINVDGILEKMDHFIQQITGLKIVLNDDVLVGELAPAMDAQLGDICSAKGRGR